MGLSQSLSILPELFKCKAAFNLIKDVVDTIPTVVLSPSLSAGVHQEQRWLIHFQSEQPYAGGRELENMEGNIRIESVSFRYPTRDITVINDLDLSVSAGQRIALVCFWLQQTLLFLTRRYYIGWRVWMR